MKMELFELDVFEIELLFARVNNESIDKIN